MNVIVNEFHEKVYDKLSAVTPVSMRVQVADLPTTALIVPKHWRLLMLGT